MAYPLAHWLIIPLLRRRVTRVTGAEHLPRSLPYIVVANHSSWLDSAYLVAILSAHTDKKIYIIASTKKYQSLGALPIDLKQPARVLDECAVKLAAGHPVIIFPEGNSNPDPVLRRGKTGAARLAQRTRVPIIPIGIHGTSASHFIRSIVNFFAWWQPIAIVIGPPLVVRPTASVESLSRDIMNELSHISGKALPYA